MTTYNISCYNENKELQHFSVPKEVYIYVRQLEAYVNYEPLSKLNELYPFRFSKEKKPSQELFEQEFQTVPTIFYEED